jgi:molecular chaperone DnaK (HSP70)
MSIVFGIDLGTTSCCLSYYLNGHLSIINDNNKSTIKSKVYFNEDNNIVCGNKITGNINNKNLIYDVKRLIGRNFNDTYIKKLKTILSYDIVDKNNDIYINTPIGECKPEDISAILLSALKNLIIKELGITDIKAVVTIPAYFNDSQRHATKCAIEKSGIQLIRMINEPTAAALYYGINDLQSDKYIFVYDIGGGTLDVSILNIDNGVFNVIATHGNSFLGGQTFTETLYEWCVEYFKNQIDDNNIEIHHIKLNRLKKECEKTKIKLTNNESSTILINNFWGVVDLKIKITKDMFNIITQDILNECIDPIYKILNNSDLTIQDLDEVLLVGGSSVIPELYNRISGIFKKKLQKIDNPEHIVSAGAAIHGFTLENKDNKLSKDIVLIDVTSLSLGIETTNNIFNVLIPRSTSIPTTKIKRFTTDTDYDEFIDIKIYEGDCKFVKDNYLIGEFTLSGIKKAPKGVPIIEITFSVDINGLVRVTAKDIYNESMNELIVKRKSIELDNDFIKELIEKSEEQFVEDLEKEIFINKTWELNELLNIIHNNLESSELKMDDEDKQIIFEDLNDIKNKFKSLDSNELINLIINIKKKYSLIVLQNNNDGEFTYDDVDNDEYTNIDELYDENTIQKSHYIQQLLHKCKMIESKLSEHDKPLIDYIYNLTTWIKNNDLDKDIIITKEEQLDEYVKEYYKIHDTTSLNEIIKICTILLNDINDNSIDITNDQSILLKTYLLEQLHETEFLTEVADFWNNKLNEINEYCCSLVN